MTFVVKKRGCFDEQQHLMSDDLVFVDKNVENVDKNVENVENDKMFHICRQPSTLHSPLQQLDRSQCQVKNNSTRTSIEEFPIKVPQQQQQQRCCATSTATTTAITTTRSRGRIRNGCRCCSGQQMFFKSLPTVAVLLLMAAGSCHSQYTVYRQDPFALLSGTLQTYQRAACDSQVLNLECPVGTKISIQLVQYGRSLPSAQVCPPTDEYPRVYDGTEPFQCSFPEALKFIEEKCHGQEVCSMVTAPEVFGAGAAAVGQNRDPCPRYRKYVEVAYKCKPTQFKSRVVCRGNSLHLSCNHPDERLAIYSAAFASAVGSHIYCPAVAPSAASSYSRPQNDAAAANVNANNNDDDDYNGVSNPEQDAVQKCLSSFATEAVMQICHGKSTCDVMADGAALGAPACTPDHNIYLKSVYTCVNKHIFKDEFRDDLPKTTSTTTTTTTTTPTTTTTTTSTTTMSTTSESDLFFAGLPTDKSVPPAKSKDGEDEGPVGRASLPGPSLVHRTDGVLDDSAYLNINSNSIDDDNNDNNNGASKVEVVTDANEEERNNFVVGFFSDFFASYKHIQNHKAKFILFLTLSIALGLVLFLGMVVWGMYRSSRLTRIAQRLKRPRTDAAPSHGGSSNNSPINAFGGSNGNGNMMTSSPSSPCPPGTVDIELEVGDHEVDSVFRDPGMNPLIVARSDSPIMHPLMGNNCNNAYPILSNSNNGGYVYGTLNRRNQPQNFGHSGGGPGGVMTLGRPRSERYCDGEIETHFQQQKRVQFPPEEFADHQRYGGTIWTPLVQGGNMMLTPQQPNSSVSGSIRDESPEETFSSSPATSPLLQINHYQLNNGYDPYHQQQQQQHQHHNHHNGNNINNNMIMIPAAQSPTNSDRQAVRYSTICRQGRIAPTMTHGHGGQGPSPVRSVVIVAPGDPPLSPTTTANLMAQRESRMLSRAHQNGGCVGGDGGDAPRSMTLSRISPNGGEHLFYG